ncbi:hypothetical protein BC826DRAFT_135063 [Russula brevipes]|nr:hypothetical protein BC826DRAFT_135063 [Russula brevipes]
MRSTTLFSLLATSLALLSQSPATCAAPVPSDVDSAGIKRQCSTMSCRATAPPSGTTPGSPVDELVKVLMGALQRFRNSTSSATPPIDLANPVGPGAEPVDDPVDPIDPADNTV